MKNIIRLLFTFLVTGLINSPTLAQFIAESDTIQFHYPLEVGNVWIYSFTDYFHVSGRDYERWEVMEYDESELKGQCATISAERIYDKHQGRVSFELCMNQNRLYRYPGTFGGDFLRHGDIESELMVDFNGEFFVPFEVQVFGIYGTINALKTRGYDNDVMTWRITENGSEAGCNSFYSRCEHEYVSGLGFTNGLVSGDDLFPNWMRLKGAFLNGVLTGDTTFVYTTSIDDVLHPERGEEPALLGNYPNPFNPFTVVRFQLSVFGEVSVKVHDLLGREVAVLVNERMPSGLHTVTFDASGLPSGMYVIVLETAAGRDVRKVSLVK